MKKVFLTTIFAVIMIGSSMIYTSCNKEPDFVSNDKNQKEGFTQSSTPTDFILAELVPFLDGNSSDFNEIDSLLNLDQISYSYFNPEINEANIYYFTQDQYFYDFVENTDYEQEVMNLVFQLDSLSTTGDENDTSEYYNELKISNNIERENIRRLHLGGVSAHKGSAWTGQHAYYYGWRRNLGQFNQQITSMQHYLTGVTAWCYGKNFVRPRNIFFSLGYISIDLTGSSANNRYQSVL